MGDIQLIRGDCLEEMQKIPAGSVDLVLCDLPYGTTDCAWDTVLPMSDLWEQWERITKQNALIVLFGAEPFSSAVRMSNIKRYRYDWIWKKRYSTGFMNAKKEPLRNYENIMVFYAKKRTKTDTTNYFKASKDYLIGERDKARRAGYNINKILNNHMASHYFTRGSEFSFPSRKNYEKLQSTGYFQREYDEARQEYKKEQQQEYKKAQQKRTKARRPVYNPQMAKGKPYISKGRKSIEIYDHVRRLQTVNTGTRYPVQVLEFGRDPDAGYHPTQKPVKLLEYLIKTYTNEGATVLDNCMGSGSTGVACVNTGRNFIGIEKEEKYYTIARERIARAGSDRPTDAGKEKKDA